MRLMILLSLASLSSGGSAFAQGPDTLPSECVSVAEPWREPRLIGSARDAADAGQTSFGVGEAVKLELHPDGEVAYITLPKEQGEAASFGGMASFTVDHTGTYRVALSEPVWVDVAQDGKPAATVHFGPGPACSGIRKAVSFELRPGLYVLEVSGGLVAKVGVFVELLR
jgi:hypothetical protein